METAATTPSENVGAVPTRNWTGYDGISRRVSIRDMEIGIELTRQSRQVASVESHKGCRRPIWEVYLGGALT